jgi:hypothetical protein
MDPSQRFALFAFPQFFDGAALGVNIVVLPRNQNPLAPAIVGEAPIPDAVAFADAKLKFVARVVTGLTGMPGTAAARPPIVLPTVAPTQARPLFEALAGQFKIDNLGATNTNANVNAVARAAPLPVPVERSVCKYLPHTYRNAFTFVAPRTPNAKTDDAYHCAVRAAAPVPGFVPSTDVLSWGQVFAAAMRQQQLAIALGMIYTTTLAIDDTLYPHGGWLWIELADGSDFKAQADVDAQFCKRYATRIPPLQGSASRSVFGALHFPVSTAVPPGAYDELFVEAADYDDGFARVVHAFQPVSASLLVETPDGAHPTHDAGIRLGWDDEQILVWYMRQLAEDTRFGSGARIDAPIGMFGYRIDVRRDVPAPGAWQSLNEVSSKAPLVVKNSVTGVVTTLGDWPNKELAYPVYPSQIDGDGSKTFWLPMYFASWTGKSMVLHDDEAAKLYQHGDAKARPDINVSGPPAQGLNATYRPEGLATPLRYGTPYQFRVRMADLSGGGPEVERTPTDELPSQVAKLRFKRYVAPDLVRIEDLPANTDDIAFADDKLTLRRPLLGYPAVVYTGQYASPVALLQAASDAKPKEAFGIADPDVESVEIVVELETLRMDNLESVSGRENYIHFYTTTRTFPKASPTFDDVLEVRLDWRDCKVLTFGDPGDLGDLGLTQAEIDALPTLPLPRMRTVRLTLRAVCTPRPDYYGLEEKDPALNTRFGRTLQFKLRAEADQNERGLLGAGRAVRGIWLQPDAPPLFDGNLASLLLGRVVDPTPDMIQRLAQALGVEAKGLTLVAKRGQRLQFGCSQRIRHTLSPDRSSLTFASKTDLGQHWLCALLLDLERDWTWDGLADRSFVVERKRRFREDDPATETEVLEVGDIELSRSAPFTALVDPDRSHTTLVFIDAVEPRNTLKRKPPHAAEARFPDLIEVGYTITPVYQGIGAAATDAAYALSVELPITTPPAQVPRIVSAGLALSPYLPHDDYSATEPRRRALWIEFAEPVADPQDTYFVRVLASAPDQLVSDNRPELLVSPDEPALPIDPEPIRQIGTGQPNDDAGLDAMQPMEKAIGPAGDADRFYLLPLPPGLHAESPELFGLFTYEFRVGHYRYTDDTAEHKAGEDVWTTAQGRYGRALRVPGLQHPAPTLTCTVDRDQDKLSVNAPFAVAVHDGKNVTANPPRTALWALLYAQVRQADDRGFRNLLLDDRVLSPLLRVAHGKPLDWLKAYTAPQRATLEQAALSNFRDGLVAADARKYLKLADPTTVNPDATRYGTAVWTNDEVTVLLAQYGLPATTSLSVLCVEILPHITNVFEHVSGLADRVVRDRFRTMVGADRLPGDGVLAEGAVAQDAARRSLRFDGDRPLSAQLGQYRILRTSPLCPVPFVCCT